MIFLISKIFFYILLAGLVGAAAGWLIRNLQAQRSEENALRAAHDAKSKVPQLESLLRGRDEQLVKLKDIVAEKQAELAQQQQTLRDMEKKLRDQEREASRRQQSAPVNPLLSADELDMVGDNSSETDELIAELSAEITRLKTQLAQQPSASLPSVGEESLDQVEFEAMRLQLTQLDRQLKETHTELQREQHKVIELERERELQNKSLQVLHQQLELERTRRVANG